MTKSQIKLFLSCFVLVLSLGCAKENRYNYLNIEITVTDYYTGQPVPWKAYAEYTINGEDFTTLIGIGEGYKHIVEKRPGKGSSYNIRIYYDQENYAVYPHYYLLSNQYVTVNSGKKHSFTFQAKPTRKFKFILTNTNCTGPNDSVFIKILERPIVDYIYTGCLNQFNVVNSDGWSTFINVPEVNFRIKTIKNGIVDSFYVQQSLQATGITPISIDY